MAGFAVGLADRSRIIDGSAVREGDILVGLSSSGVHSNGFSLLRKIFFEQMGLAADSNIPELGATIGETLLTPTSIYTYACRSVSPYVRINGMVHITGGGFFENIPRALPEGLGVSVRRDSWEVPAIFPYIMRCGNVDEEEMFSTFNMGVGLIMIVSPDNARFTTKMLNRTGYKAFVIGEVTAKEGVSLC
jgi:phosphoribosylformylglycinamidine cyclo-ligase